jgi:hypothetical protein
MAAEHRDPAEIEKNAEQAERIGTGRPDLAGGALYAGLKIEGNQKHCGRALTEQG